MQQNKIPNCASPMGPVLSANQDVAQERGVRGYVIATLSALHTCNRLFIM